MTPSLVFFDLEGTLFKIPNHSHNVAVAVSAWTVLAQRLGPACLREEEESKLAWQAGKFRTYLEWMQHSIELLIRHGLTKRTFFEVIDQLEETPGIRIVASELHRMGATLAIVSGGFKQVADRAQIAMRASHAMAACELFFDEESQHVLHWNLLPSDFLGKIDFMRLLIREYGVNASDCVFVGDGPNDIPLAREVGLSIAYGAHEALRRETTYAISPLEGESFTKIIDLILNH